MNKTTLNTLTVLSSCALLLFSSCSGCVKKTTKKITEVTMSAAEGVAEAIDENGAALAEKTANAASSIALGLGRSLDKQLDQHAEKIASVGGRTIIQTVDGLTEGLSTELKSHYENISYTSNLSDGIELDYIAKFKEGSVFDAYFIISKIGTYDCKFEFFDKNDKVFITKETVATKQEGNTNRYTLISFALTNQQIEQFTNDFKEVKVTVIKN